MKENSTNSLEDQIREVLFDLGKDIKIHKVDNVNMIIEIDYEKYVEKLKSILGGV
jgi:TPP-dependent indolepyruvate ferredoxin oxidoreductase alpha subunit